jgi:hypothetical protein
VNEHSLLWYTIPWALPDGFFLSYYIQILSSPGLWLDAEAMPANDRPRVLAALKKGLVTPEHTALVARLGKQGSRKCTAGGPGFFRPLLNYPSPAWL